MRCREAREALADRELSPGSEPAGAALRAHIAGCPDCAARASAEQLLSEALRELRSDVVPTVDVTAQVLAGLPGAERPGPDELSTRQLGWAAAVALSCGGGLLAALWLMLPAMGGPAREIWTFAASLRHTLGSIGSAAVTLISSGLKVAGRLLEALAPIAGALQGLEPVAITGLACCTAVMAGTIVLVVGRDMRTRVLNGKGNTI